MSDQINKDSMVVVTYTLSDLDGEVIQESSGPIPYVHGYDQIFNGLEEALEGRSTGDTFQVELPPEQAFGVRHGDGPSAVPRSQFPDDVELIAGMQFGADTEDGVHITVFITEVDETTVWVDEEHPLAGVGLRFDVEVLSVRPATADELSRATEEEEQDI